MGFNSDIVRYCILIRLTPRVEPAEYGGTERHAGVGTWFLKEDRVLKKMFGTFDIIGQGIEYWRWDLMLQLYKAFVRPHLKYRV